MSKEAMMIYLIDFENCHAQGLKGIEALSADDQVHVFLGASNKASASVLDACVNQSKAKVSFHKCTGSSQNYLDFQLATHLGHLIGALGRTDFCIISGDQGYFSLRDYWIHGDPGIKIIQRLAIDSESKLLLRADRDTKKAMTKAKSSKNPPECIRKAARKIYFEAGLDISKIGMLYELMRSATDMIAFNNDLTKAFGAPLPITLPRGKLIKLFCKYQTLGAS